MSTDQTSLPSVESARSRFENLAKEINQDGGGARIEIAKRGRSSEPRNSVTGLLQPPIDMEKMEGYGAQSLRKVSDESSAKSPRPPKPPPKPLHLSAGTPSEGVTVESRVNPSISPRIPRVVSPRQSSPVGIPYEGIADGSKASPALSPRIPPALPPPRGSSPAWISPDRGRSPGYLPSSHQEQSLKAPAPPASRPRTPVEDQTKLRVSPPTESDALSEQASELSIRSVSEPFPQPPRLPPRNQTFPEVPLSTFIPPPRHFSVDHINNHGASLNDPFPNGSASKSLNISAMDPHALPPPPPLPIMIPRPISRASTSTNASAHFGSVASVTPRLPPRSPSRSNPSSQASSNPSYSSLNIPFAPSEIIPDMPPRPSRSISPQRSANVPLSDSFIYRVSPSSSQTDLSIETALSDDDDSDDHTSNNEIYSEYPDSSQANRRPPIFEGPIHELVLKGEARCARIYGNIACVSSTVTKVFDLTSGEVIWASEPHPEVKVTAIGFKPDKDPGREGSILWVGTKDGQLWEIDINKQDIVAKRTNVHLTPIVLIHRFGDILWTLSDDGKTCVWEGDLNSNPKTYRVSPHLTSFVAVGPNLWIGRNRQIHLYFPTVSSTSAFSITTRPLTCLPSTTSRQQADFTCAAFLPTFPDYVFFGHEDGTVSIFSQSKMIALENVVVSIHKICSLRGIGKTLWIGLKNGMILVCDVTQRPWKVMKEWKAHDGPVLRICCSHSSLWKSNVSLPVITLSTGNVVAIWDGLMKRDWIGK